MRLDSVRVPNSTGMSYPVRLNNTGGFIVSTATGYDLRHIEESIEQILLTKRGERVMQPEFHCDIESLLFDPNDDTLKAIATYHILEALERWETRIEVKESDIRITNDLNKVGIEVYFRLINSNIEGSTTVNIPVGGE